MQGVGVCYVCAGISDSVCVHADIYNCTYGHACVCYIPSSLKHSDFIC